MPIVYPEEIQDAPAIPLRDPELQPYYGPQPGELEASGYIAPFVDEFGQAQSTAYDSRQADIEAQTMARRFKGAQLYQSLVSGGATPPEAFRLAAPDLLFNDVSAQIKAIPKMGSQPFNPTFTDVEGGRLLRRGPNSVQFIRNPTPPADQAEKELSRRRTRLDEGQLAIARQDLQRAKAIRDKLEKSDPGRMQAAQEVARLESALGELQTGYTNIPQSTAVSIPSALEPQTVVERTPEGISMRRETPQRPAETATDEKVVVTKGGKRFRLPKSQLEQARKEGYKLAQ
jgi:hypothetical protein